MKKVLFLLPALVLGLVLTLTFCAKQPQEDALQQLPDGVANNRTNCTLTITGTSTLVICGTDEINGALCNACVAGGSGSIMHKGSQTLLSGSGTVVLNFNGATAPYPFSIFNTGTTTSKYLIDTGVNFVKVQLDPGQCEELAVDANCNIWVI